MDHDGRGSADFWEAIIRLQGMKRRYGRPGDMDGSSLAEGAGARAGAGKVRFALMEEEYLRDRVVGMAPAEDAEWMEGVVAEELQVNKRGATGQRRLQIRIPATRAEGVGLSRGAVALRVKWGG